jgi:hypothetical protein
VKTGMVFIRKANNIISLITLITMLSCSLFVACAATSKTGSPSGNTQTTYSSDYQIKFFLKNQQVASLGLTELHSLPQVTLTIAGKSEIGPTFTSVLELAGIKDYSSVLVSGMLKGRLATGELTLKHSDITGEVILSYNNQGKTKLCGMQIPDTNWIIDVAEIKVQ